MSLKRHLGELNLAGGQIPAWLERAPTPGPAACGLPETSLEERLPPRLALLREAAVTAGPNTVTLAGGQRTLTSGPRPPSFRFGHVASLGKGMEGARPGKPALSEPAGGLSHGRGLGSRAWGRSAGHSHQAVLGFGAGHTSRTGTSLTGMGVARVLRAGKHGHLREGRKGS